MKIERFWDAAGWIAYALAGVGVLCVVYGIAVGLSSGVLWLKDGLDYQIPAMVLFEVRPSDSPTLLKTVVPFGVFVNGALHEWLIRPSDWIGLHASVSWVLNRPLWLISQLRIYP
jgi:hypothetical protein